MGAVRVERAYYVCKHCHAGHCPRDAELGLTKGDLSRGATEAVALAGGYDRRASSSSATIYRNNQEMDVPPDTLVQPGDTIEIPRRFF